MAQLNESTSLVSVDSETRGTSNHTTTISSLNTAGTCKFTGGLSTTLNDQHIADRLNKLTVSDNTLTSTPAETASFTLLKYLSVRTTFWEQCSDTERQQRTTSAEPQTYLKIGGGTCGKIYVQHRSSCLSNITERPPVSCNFSTAPIQLNLPENACIKKEKPHSYVERDLKNDFIIHQLLYRTFAKYKVDIHIPYPSHFVEKEEKDFWSANQLLFPPEDRVPSRLIFAERIPTLPRPLREALIDEYCAYSGKEHQRASQRHCLIRTYLGRVQTRSGPSKFFNLENFALHANQCEALGLDVSPFITAMAKALAIMHYDAKVDARDVEFVLGGKPTSADHDFTNSYNSLTREVHYWMLDFNQVTSITMDEAGLRKAAEAFRLNDPYYPRPGRGPASWWELFKKEYVAQSQEILDEEQWSLAGRFLEMVEEVM